MTLIVLHRLASRALVRVRGADWRPFLQNLLSNDVETLAIGQARAALLLTPQGKLLFDLIVRADAQGVLLDVLAERRDALIQRLKLYRLRARIEIEAAEGAVWAAVGARPDGDWFADPRLAALGWRGYGAAAPAGATVADESVYRAHALALGVPDPALDCVPDKTFPLEADFDLLGAIDFHKGCYVGQETTSRMKRRSAVKTRMVPITFNGPPPRPGTPVQAGGDLRAGEVLSGAEGRAMALLRLDRAVGAELTVEGRAVKLDIPDWWPSDVLPTPSGDGAN